MIHPGVVLICRVSWAGFKLNAPFGRYLVVIKYIHYEKDG